MEIAIITQHANPWTYMLIHGCLAWVIDVVVLNENSQPGRPYWMSRRFLQRLGLATDLDLAVLKAAIPPMGIFRTLRVKRLWKHNFRTLASAEHDPVPGASRCTV